MPVNSHGDRRRIRGSVAVFICVLGLMTGCTAPTTDSRIAQNQSMWTMPLDEFKVSKPPLANYAEQLLIAKCLDAHGYSWPVPWQDTDFPEPETVNSTALKLFNADIASRFGYHDAPPPNPAEALAWAEFASWANTYDPDDEFGSRFESCGADARDDQTLADADGLNYVAGLEVQARDEISSSTAVRDAARSWKACLSKIISFELPTDPWSEMPTAEMAQEFGIFNSDTSEAASSEEIAIAEADAECRDTSGYTDIRYQAEWAAQEILVARNRDKLDRIRNEAIAHAEELMTSIAANAPSR